MEKTTIDFLIDMPIFNSLDTAELNLVSKCMRKKQMKEGNILFMEGDKGDAVYFIIAGELSILKQSIKNEDVALTSLSAGKSIGEMSIIDETPRSATVQVSKESILLALSKSDFDNILKEYPPIGIKILKGIARLLSLNMRKTSSRLADYLLPFG